jgi:hypothetical protein
MLETRFDQFSARNCMIALVALVLALVASLLSPTYQAPDQPPQQVAADGQLVGPVVGMSDTKLYKTIIARVSNGEGYYAAMADEHRRHEFPLKPFITVRPPILAWINAALGPTLTLGLFGLLIAATVLSWLPLMAQMTRVGFEGYLAYTVIILSVMLLIAGPFRFYHESWAAPLIAISLALWVQGRIVLSVIAGLTAVLLRELAMPYLVMMAIMSAYERRGLETKAWAIAIGISCLAAALHYTQVNALLQPDDLGSQGWSGRGGWPYFVATVKETSLMAFLPDWAIKLAIPLSLFGWMSCRSGLGLRITGLLLGYATALMLFARDANMYWGILIMPFIVTGVAFAPTGIIALWHGCQPAKSRVDFAAS